MQNIVKTAVTAACAACLALGLFGSAVASANSGHESSTDVKVSTTPPQMELSASSGEQIRSTGTQGVFSNADQCADSSMTTKVACVTPSSEAAPQVKAR